MAESVCRQSARFEQRNLLVAVYCNLVRQPVERTYYDIVIYRRIRLPSGDYEYRRGTNLKPADLLVLRELLMQAAEYVGRLEDDDAGIGLDGA